MFFRTWYVARAPSLLFLVVSVQYLFSPRIPYRGGKMQRVVRSTLVGLLTIAGLTACGDKVTIPAPVTTPVGNVVHQVTVSPSAASINVGGTFTFAASVDADAGVSNRTVTWT